MLFNPKLMYELEKVELLGNTQISITLSRLENMQMLIL
jgi:hypothetical protein